MTCPAAAIGRAPSPTTPRTPSACTVIPRARTPNSARRASIARCNSRAKSATGIARSFGDAGGAIGTGTAKTRAAGGGVEFSAAVAASFASNSAGDSSHRSSSSSAPPIPVARGMNAVAASRRLGAVSANIASSAFAPASAVIAGNDVAASSSPPPIPAPSSSPAAAASSRAIESSRHVPTAFAAARYAAQSASSFAAPGAPPSAALTRRSAGRISATTPRARVSPRTTASPAL
mmetsp:Transcript_4599/g.16318  ORF Transcript_4599/g.16318 Transcript_4599/m.16318 type:complete len:234 (+) Transcript_4599:501-1202(+)|eukprot:31477-Pelagococcus_subviridis.AAC.21